MGNHNRPKAESPQPRKAERATRRGEVGAHYANARTRLDKLLFKEMPSCWRREKFGGTNAVPSSIFYRVALRLKLLCVSLDALVIRQLGRYEHVRVIQIGPAIFESEAAPELDGDVFPGLFCCGLYP